MEEGLNGMSAVESLTIMVLFIVILPDFGWCWWRGVRRSNPVVSLPNHGRHLGKVTKSFISMLAEVDE
jgi:hypothetical protein